MKVLAAALLLALATPATAAEEKPQTPAEKAKEDANDDVVAPDRPDVANGTNTMPVGVIQVETGIAHARTDPLKRTSIETSIRTGFLRNAELRVEGEPFVSLSAPGGSTSGLGDINLSVKWRFLDQQEYRPSMGIQPYVKFPTGASEVGGSGKVDFGGALLVGQKLPADFAVDVNLILNMLSQDPSGLRAQFGAAASFSRSVTDTLTAFAEPFFFTGEASGADPIFGGDVGLIFIAHKRVALDASVEVRRQGGENALTLRGGVTFRFGGR